MPISGAAFPNISTPPSRRWKHLRVDRLLGEHGIHGDTAAGRVHFGRCMHARRNEDNIAAWDEIRRAWAVGDESFRKELLLRPNNSSHRPAHSAQVRQTAEEKATRIIAEELKRRRIKIPKLADMPKGHPAKLAIAQIVRTETTVTIPWLSSQLRAGAPGYLARLLHEQSKRKEVRD